MTIKNAIRLGKKTTDQLCLLKLSLSNIEEKIAILRNKSKLRSTSNPEDVRNVFITPDFKPLEQKRNKALREQPLDMNKTENLYVIKKWKDSAEANLNLCTDNQPPYPPHDPSDFSTNNSINSLSILVLNCQSVVAKKESFLNLISSYSPDIIVGSESWLKPSKTVKCFHLITTYIV